MNQSTFDQNDIIQNSDLPIQNQNGETLQHPIIESEETSRHTAAKSNETVSSINKDPRFMKFHSFLDRITQKKIPPEERVPYITIRKTRLIPAGIITGLLLLLILTHTGRYLHSEEIERHTGTTLLILSIVLSIVCGFAEVIQFNLPKQFSRVYSYIMYFGAPVVAALITECIQGVFIYNWSPRTFFLNYLVFLILYSLVAVFTGVFRRTILIMTPILFSFSFISMLIRGFRGTPLMPADIVTIRTGLNVASGYHYELTSYMILAIVLFVLFEIMTFRMPKLKVRRKFHRVFRLLSFLFVALTCSAFYLTSIAADNGIKPDFWNQARGYKNTGTVFNFVLNSRYLIIEKPDNYKASDIASIVNNLISDTGDDPGIFASAQEMQERQTAALSEADQQIPEGTDGIPSSPDPADTAVTIDNPGNLADLAEEDTHQEIQSGLYAFAYTDSLPDETTQDPADQALPNTGTDTKLAVQYTSDTEQPSTSATLKENDTPDVIVIMNETLSDLRILGELSTNKDYMPFLRNLTKNTIKGNLYLPVNGAGTSNSEFEFLTGNSMAFLPSGSNAYELYIKNILPSLAENLGSLGYSRIAFHTYYKESWKRNINYPLLGFEHYYALEDILDPSTVEAYREGDISLFEYQHRISLMYPGEKVLLRRFVSDSYDYKVLERMYEERNTDYPFFIFNVTMQNHGGYDLSYSNFEQRIQITSEDTFYPKANRYLSLIYESDRALKELIDYFSNVSRPVMIVMFGDHQPSIEEGFVESLLGSRISDLTVSQNQKRFVTPFLIWTNYDSESGYIEKISSNYLSTLVLQQAGLKTTLYQKYLSALYRQMPVIDTTGYITADNRYYTYDDETEYSTILDGYDKIIYNYMFDAINRNKELFYLSNS